MFSENGPAILHAVALALLQGLEGGIPSTPLSKPHSSDIGFVLTVDRLMGMDFERVMKLVTNRIDVQNDDKLMSMVFKEAVANGALKRSEV